MPKTQVLAFHLPQFHTIRENNEWWGEGFTEWTNVRKAKPLFPGHNQPRIPLEKNYYDLLDPEVQHWQAKLAGEHGISGFCYYHYWFNGKRLLEKPVEMIVERATPDFPFCLAWANEPWTRVWDGGSRNVLMPQEYGQELDWEEHFQYLLPKFRDPRYIKVEGKPMFVIYRTQSVERFTDMARYWRRRSVEAGLPGLHLVSMLTAHESDLRPNQCDAFVEFEPMCSVLRLPPPYSTLGASSQLSNAPAVEAPRFCTSCSLQLGLSFALEAPRRETGSSRSLPGAFVDFDNTPRKAMKGSLFLRNYDQGAFDEGFRTVFEKANEAGAPFMFINAWNEWAEGAYLEPDTNRGLACLEAIANVVNSRQ